jgi:hypothetical protein
LLLQSANDDDYWRRVDEARERAKDEPAEKESDDQ